MGGFHGVSLLSAARDLAKCLDSEENRERVGVVIHQYCGSCSIIPFLDFDTAGPECTV